MGGELHIFRVRLVAREIKCVALSSLFYSLDEEISSVHIIIY